MPAAEADSHIADMVLEMICNEYWECGRDENLDDPRFRKFARDLMEIAENREIVSDCREIFADLELPDDEPGS